MMAPWTAEMAVVIWSGKNSVASTNARTMTAVGQKTPGTRARPALVEALRNRVDADAIAEMTDWVREEVLALLRRANREFGITVVLITHEMDVIRRVCDRVAVLDAGQLVGITQALLDSAHAAPQPKFLRSVDTAAAL